MAARRVAGRRHRLLRPGEHRHHDDPQSHCLQKRRHRNDSAITSAIYTIARRPSRSQLRPSAPAAARTLRAAGRVGLLGDRRCFIPVVRPMAAHRRRHRLLDSGEHQQHHSPSRSSASRAASLTAPSPAPPHLRTSAHVQPDRKHVARIASGAIVCISNDANASNGGVIEFLNSTAVGEP